MSVYLVRANTATLTGGLGSPTDTLFVDQRFDRQQLSGVRFEQCTFANVSFKDAQLVNCHFSACVFEGCYFRGTTLKECHFPASRFIDCEFPKPKLYACDFRNSRFHRSAPTFTAMEPNLPGEPNLCAELCQNLASEAGALGHEREARLYRLRAIEEHEEALRRGYRWADDYSRDHYPELERLTALFSLVWSRANGWLWGHGEYIRRLLLNLILLAFFVGPLLFFITRDHLHSDGPIGLGDYVALSVASVVSDPGSSGVEATGIALAVVLGLAGAGLLFLGLFVTYVFRAVTRR